MNKANFRGLIHVALHRMKGENTHIYVYLSNTFQPQSALDSKVLEEFIVTISDSPKIYQGGKCSY